MLHWFIRLLPAAAARDSPNSSANGESSIRPTFPFYVDVREYDRFHSYDVLKQAAGENNFHYLGVMQSRFGGNFHNDSLVLECLKAKHFQFFRSYVKLAKWTLIESTLGEDFWATRLGLL
jgi:hypothetical protein